MTLHDCIRDANEKSDDPDFICYHIYNAKDKDLLFLNDGAMETGDYSPEEMKNMEVTECELQGYVLYVEVDFDRKKLFEVSNYEKIL